MDKKLMKEGELIKGSFLDEIIGIKIFDEIVSYYGLEVFLKEKKDFRHINLKDEKIGKNKNFFLKTYCRKKYLQTTKFPLDCDIIAKRGMKI